MSPKESTPESPHKETTPKRKASAVPKNEVEVPNQSMPVFGDNEQDPTQSRYALTHNK